MKKFNDSVYDAVAKHGLKYAIDNLNVQYSKIKDPGLGDQIACYKLKQSAYFESVQWDYAKINPRFCLNYSDSILRLIEKNNVEKLYKREYIDANFTKGDILYFSMHKHGEALSYYFKGKLLINELTNDCDKADFTKRFASADYEEGKFKQGASLYMQEFNQRKSCVIDFEGFAATQKAIDNAGLCYNELRMSDSAIYCFNTNLAYVNKNAGLFPLHKRFINDVHGVTNGFLGNAYYNNGDYKKAEEHLKLSIEINSKGGNEQKFSQRIQSQLARLYISTGRPKKVDSMINSIQLSLDTLPNEVVALELAKLKVDYYALLNQPALSQKHLQPYLQLKHKADLRKSDVIQADIENYFSTVQKNYDHAILEAEKKSRKLQLIIFISCTLFVMFIAFLLWNSSKKVNRQNTSLQNTLNILKQSQEENVRVLQIVAHDLRDPIGSIFAISSLMLKSPDHSEKDRTMLELIKTSGKNCLDLASDLLKVNIKPGEIKKGTINLAEMLNFCVAQLKSKADGKKQILTLETQPLNVQGSPEKLWRVISNLIGNAIKFSPEGETINISLQEGGKGVIIAVKDNGIGIPEEMQDKIFHMVGDSMRHGTAGEQPFGMGLSISKQIIDAHGGKIWFESIPGSGTIFYVELIA